MQKANVHLSEQEWELVRNPGIILTKNKILEKAGILLENVATLMQPVWKMRPDLSVQHPKISRGEKYRELPYLVLDYPRCFEKENIFALRHLFWWGHDFSVTLHLAGTYKSLFLPRLSAHFTSLQQQGWKWYRGEDPWQHAIDEDWEETGKLAEEHFTHKANRASFVKIARTLPLQQWEEAVSFFIQAGRDIFTITG